MGMPVDKIIDMAKKCYFRTQNMIMGNTAWLIANEGISVDITANIDARKRY